MSEPDDARPEVRDPRITAGERVYIVAVWVVLLTAVLLGALGQGFTAPVVVLFAIALLGILGWAGWVLLLMRRIRRG